MELYIFDCAGAEFYRDLLPSYWDGSAMMLVAYDCSRPETFDSCSGWIKRVKEACPSHAIPGVLVATRCDLKDPLSVDTQKAKDLAVSNGLEFFETSAKSNTEVDAPFHWMANTFYRSYEEKVEAVALE